MATFELAPPIPPLETAEQKGIFHRPLEAADIVIIDSEDEDKNEHWRAVPATQDGVAGISLEKKKGIRDRFHEGILIIHGAAEVGGFIEPASRIRCRRIKGEHGKLALFITPEEPVSETSIAWYALSDQAIKKRRTQS